MKEGSECSMKRTCVGTSDPEKFQVKRSLIDSRTLELPFRVKHGQMVFPKVIKGYIKGSLSFFYGLQNILDLVNPFESNVTVFVDT